MKEAELATGLPAIRRANKADLAQFFNVELTTINRWVTKGLPVVQEGSKGVAWIFDLRAVASWKYAGTKPGAPGERRDPEDMEPRERRDWYEGESKRVALSVQNGDLVTIDEYRLELAAVLKEVAATLETLPDVLERKCALDGGTLETMQEVIDAERAMLADRIVAASGPKAEPPADG